MNLLTPLRLDLADLSRRLYWLYRLRPFKSKRIRCGKVALGLLLGLMVLGLVAGAISGVLSGAESVALSALNAGFIAGLVANVLAIAWIGAIGSDRPVVSSRSFPRLCADLMVRSADYFRQYRPPRFVA